MLSNSIRPFVSRRSIRWMSGSSTDLLKLLEDVKNGAMQPSDVEKLIRSGNFQTSGTTAATTTSPEETLQAFANLDHTRSSRTGFPEAVFASGKTPHQVAKILDDMARHLNEQISDGVVEQSQRAILATRLVPAMLFAFFFFPNQIFLHLQKETKIRSYSFNFFSNKNLPTKNNSDECISILLDRVTPEQFYEVQEISLNHGSIHYHETARIISMVASGLDNSISTETKHIDASATNPITKKVIVATAGTTDLPVAEEAAVVLEAANCNVDRIYDVGVAGLHRIVNALPRLRDPEVGCVIVCAGMDGALPSVVGGLVSVPVIAVPTSIGYGVSLGGISAMLTMLNTCAPGVGVVNIDNGFGAAALAYKCLLP